MSMSSVVLVLLAVCLLIVCQLTQTTEFFFLRLGLKTGINLQPDKYNWYYETEPQEFMDNRWVNSL